MYYVKSTATGQIYAMKFVPKFGGYEQVSREEFLQWCKENGFKPSEMGDK